LGHFLSEKFSSKTNSCRAMGKPEVAAILNVSKQNLVVFRHFEHFLFEIFFLGRTVAEIPVNLN
jgi:hypothetical protein